MLSPGPEPLAAWTTLRLGGPAHLTHAATRQDLYAAAEKADAEGQPLLVLGGGTNLVIGDRGFAGSVVRVDTSGVVAQGDSRGGVEVTVEAGESWDGLVERAIREEWIGIEALAGIPGSVGAVPIQNVGAYGQEVAETIAQVHVFDRLRRRRRTMFAADCEFGYRTSVFKRHPERYVVGAVTFQFRPGHLSTPVTYAELARTLGVEIGHRAAAADVRTTVLRLRTGKGMVLDPEDHDTWSAGSFFTNPFVSPDALPDGAPGWPQPDGRVKTSAAWLIEQAGFTKGYGNARVALSSKHTLALTNRGGATTDDLVALAREVREGVRVRFGIELHPEPTFVGVSL